VKALLRTSRLLTLTGSGGCGKTRLSLQVAADLVDASADGVYYRTRGPGGSGLVPQALATVLGSRKSGA
jgi:predicted ATPase